MEALKIIFTITAVALLILIFMLFIRRFRKIALILLGVMILVMIVVPVIIFTPKKYDRNYLSESPGWKDLRIRYMADSIGFYLGAIPGSPGISDPLFCDNFNSVTPDNALKMGPLFKNGIPGEYDFIKADSIVDKALSLGLRVRGHTLIWGKQSDMFKRPDLGKWLEQYPEDERSRILKKTVEDHIATVMNHFRGRVRTWDCVNEPMSMTRPGKLESNVYLKYLGEEYIADAFRLAHATYPEAELFLNENFYSYNGKMADGFIALLQKMKDNDVPVHGAGIQSHVSDTSIADLRSFIGRITEMGLKVEITELDARIRIFNGADDPYEAQGKYYARLIEACMSDPLCRGVTFWGFSDDRDWMKSMIFFPKPTDPYFFDAEMNPKPAFLEVYNVFRNAYEKRTLNKPRPD